MFSPILHCNGNFSSIFVQLCDFSLTILKSFFLPRATAMAKMYGTRRAGGGEPGLAEMFVIRASLISGGKLAESDVEHKETRRENRAGISRRARSMPAQTHSRGCDWPNRLWGIKFRRDPPQTTNASPRLAAGGWRNHKTCSNDQKLHE